MSELRLEGVSKNFGTVAALNGVTLHANAGELVVILGPTGAGKTTALRCIAGLEDVDAGKIFLGGDEITRETPARRDVAVVFQNFSLYPHLSVGGNLSFPLRAKWRGHSEAEIQERVAFAAKILHIEDLLDRKPALLSGGQMQRVAIGRALVRQPRLFLMDEPLTNLDAKLREELRFELKAIQRKLGATTVYVTHDPVEAMSLADRLVILDAGRVLQDGAPGEVYARPRHRRAGELLGTPPMNFLQARIEGGRVCLLQAPHVGWPLRELGAAASPDGELSAGIRPEQIAVCADGKTEATCELVEFFGADVVALFKIGEARVRVVCPEHASLRAGENYRLSIPAAVVHLFDRSGVRIADSRPASR